MGERLGRFFDRVDHFFDPPSLKDFSEPAEGSWSPERLRDIGDDAETKIQEMLDAPMRKDKEEK